MGLRVALGEMFPLTAMCPRMWSSLVLLVYLVQLVRNTSSSYSGLQDMENTTSTLLHILSVSTAGYSPDVANGTPSIVDSSTPGVVSGVVSEVVSEVVSPTMESRDAETTAEDTNNYTILKSKLKTPDKLPSNASYDDIGNFTDYEYDVSNTSDGTPWSSTRKAIYIRGHLLHSQRAVRTFHPGTLVQRDFSRAHRAHLKDTRKEGDGPGDCGKGEPCRQHGEPNIINHIGNPVRRKKKHSHTGRKKFYNYKLLYDTIRTKDTLHQKETEFYAWIFGAAMLTLGSLTTIASCFAFCFCGDKWRKRRDQRRRIDKSGEYQRVDSVSSIVDNANHQEELYDDQIDSVTII